MPRSIPACAGEPASGVRWRDGRGVYPRVRGGTTTYGTVWRVRQGLSPRARGNLRQHLLDKAGVWSIPACAGEPTPVPPPPELAPVYPRVRGGTRKWMRRRGLRKGLSPRARGNPADGAGAAAPERSIPACAGEPL